MSTEVPLIDLSGQDIPESVKDTVETGRFIGGEAIPAFEGGWAQYIGAEEVVATSSGTMALFLIFRYLSGLYHKHRNKVVIPATSFVATRDAAIHAGLEPIGCDVNAQGLMDIPSLIETLSEHHEEVCAIVPVHLYGNIVDVEVVEAVAEGFGVPLVIEDACQAHGALYKDRTAVGTRNIAAWSFMPAKILGTWGDGGAVSFPHNTDSEIKRWIRSAHNHGREDGEHKLFGYKGRMDTIKALVLSDKLVDLVKKNYKRARHARQYNTELSSYPLRLPEYHPNRVWSYYTVWAEDELTRDQLKQHLHEDGIAARSHYPYSLFPGEFETADKLARTVITLPLWPEMTDLQRVKVVNSIGRFYRDS